VTESLLPWGPQLPNRDNVPEVAQPEVLKECATPFEACADASFAAVCFISFYVFNETRRDAMRSCFGLSCVGLNDCMDDNLLKGAPWVAIPPHEGGFFP
jgi:hypothetical protein